MLHAAVQSVATSVTYCNRTAFEPRRHHAEATERRHHLLQDTVVGVISNSPKGYYAHAAAGDVRVMRLMTEDIIHNYAKQ